MNDYLSDVFGEQGLFAAHFPGYEMREGQVALARMVDEAMRSSRHGLGEGPCGTGKGVAYGVPSVWHVHHEKRRVVIATANIALQEQLVEKDLPLLTEVLPWPFTFALLKGRNNYLCLDRLRESEARGELSGLYDDDQDRQADQILEWAHQTETGDVSELPFVPLPQVWSKASVSSEECKGEDCPFRDDCFFERARKIAKEANIVVTNYHMLFAHLAVRRETGQDLVLPPFDFLVCDEAHEAAEIARDFFGFTVSAHTINRLARSVADLGERRLADSVRQKASEFFDRVSAYARSSSYRCRLRQPAFVPSSNLVRSLEEIAEECDEISADDRNDREARSLAKKISRISMLAAERISEAVGQSDSEKVFWIELDSKGRARLKAKPIDVSELLHESLFKQTESVTLVSATLAAGGSFEFVRGELGVPPDALELVADSPFDFKSQALLVVPDELPDPRDFDFPEAVARLVDQVMHLCDGRTLGLFTSYRVLNTVYDRVSGNGHRVLRQGDQPRTELARIFKEDVRSVLLGTESFWTGIDVPGQALTGLVIDKLPFPHPEDPVVSAICERDRQAFHNYLVPKAIIALRQGVGRLIRSQSDFGVVVLLDRRIAEKSYGRRFLRSLPPMLGTRRMENISRFLEEAANARAS